MTGKNYRTVKKYIEKENFNEKEHKVIRKGKSDLVRPIINKWLTEDKSRHHKQRHTAKRIFDRLRDEYPELLKVRERTIRKVVHEERIKIHGSNDVYLNLHHPGGEAQVDFGTFMAYENGDLKIFHELILSFPKSNAGFVVVTRSETREALLKGLTEIFRYIGYVPTSIWFDQMSSAALRKKDEKGKPKVSDFFMRFSTHYGFKAKFCNPYSGNEKGNVENKVGTIRRNFFVPEPTINDIDKFNQELLVRSSEANQKVHYKLKRPVSEIFNEEKSLMIPANEVIFDICRYESRKVNKFGMIDFSRCRYSVSPKFIAEYVKLKIGAERIEIYSNDMSELITSHPRLFGKGEESVNYVDFIDVIKMRPNALKYTGIYTLLPESWRKYLDSLDKEELRQAFTVLKEIIIEDDLDYADKVLKETIKYGSVSPEAVKITYKRLKEDKFIYEDSISVKSILPAYEVDTARYDVFLEGKSL